MRYPQVSRVGRSRLIAHFRSAPRSERRARLPAILSKNNKLKDECYYNNNNYPAQRTLHEVSPEPSVVIPHFISSICLGSSNTSSDRRTAARAGAPRMLSVRVAFRALSDPRDRYTARLAGIAATQIPAERLPLVCNNRHSYWAAIQSGTPLDFFGSQSKSRIATQQSAQRYFDLRPRESRTQT